MDGEELFAAILEIAKNPKKMAAGFAKYREEKARLEAQIVKLRGVLAELSKKAGAVLSEAEEQAAALVAEGKLEVSGARKAAAKIENDVKNFETAAKRRALEVKQAQDARAKDLNRKSGDLENGKVKLEKDQLFVSNLRVDLEHRLGLLKEAAA